jgi:Na+-driven multidrug efflux pump
MNAIPLRLKSLLDTLKQWDWALYLLIFVYMALPQFYRSYSIYLIGNAIPDTGALATVAQYQFVDLLLEVIQETFVLAIFFFVGKGLQSREGPGSPIRTSLTLILMVSVVLAAVLFSFSSSFVSIIGTPQAIQETTSAFLKIKTAAVPIFLLSAALVVIVETINRKRLILILAVMQVIYRFILDSLFYGGYSFSLDMGVLGVAWADVFSSLALLITALILIRRPLMNKIRNWREFFSFRDWQTYLRVGGWSGLDSLVRNLAYFFLIIRLLNLLGENTIGGYYLAMHILWSFLLVPILALSESLKVLVANNSENIFKVRQLWLASMLIGIMVLVIWAGLLPFWRSFAGILNSNAEVVNISVQAMTLLIAPYMLFALNNTTDAIFYGLGKTKYIAYQNVITNGVVYGGAFIAYLTGYWTPTFTSIMVLFASGIVVDSILTTYYAWIVMRPRQRRLAGASPTTQESVETRK